MVKHETFKVEESFRDDNIFSICTISHILLHKFWSDQEYFHKVVQSPSSLCLSCSKTVYDQSKWALSELQFDSWCENTRYIWSRQVSNVIHIWWQVVPTTNASVCISVFYKKQMNTIWGSCLRRATSHPSLSDKVVHSSLVSDSLADTASFSPCLPVSMFVTKRWRQM